MNVSLFFHFNPDRLSENTPSTSPAHPALVVTSVFGHCERSRSFHSAFECVLTVLLGIKFMDPSASGACIHLSELKTNSGAAGARVAKYSLIFCGYLISQE